MGIFKKDDPIVEKDYSDISDIDELIKKLADECAKIARTNVVKDIILKNIDNLMECEIKKFSKRLSEIGTNKNNNLQAWFSRWMR